MNHPGHCCPGWFGCQRSGFRPFPLQRVERCIAASDRCRTSGRR
jgi:hypothetical protein